MSATKPQPSVIHLVERIAAMLAAVACLVITIVIWRNVSAYQPMWPLPGVYFVELPAVSLAAALGWNLGLSWARPVTWAALGIVLAFSILGAFSVGMLYFPVAALLAVASIASDLRAGQRIAPHVGICLAAAVAQAALMLLAVRWLHPTAIF